MIVAFFLGHLFVLARAGGLRGAASRRGHTSAARGAAPAAAGAAFSRQPRRPRGPGATRSAGRLPTPLPIGGFLGGTPAAANSRAERPILTFFRLLVGRLGLLLPAQRRERVAFEAIHLGLIGVQAQRVVQNGQR